MLQGNESLIRLKAALDRVVAKLHILQADERELVVFGTGATADFYQKCFDREGIRPAYFADNNTAKWGIFYCGVQVISPAELKADHSQLILVCSANFTTAREISQQLSAAGLEYLRMDEYLFAKHMEDILTCAQMMDTVSMEIYSGIILGYLNNEPVKKYFQRHQYFAIPEFMDRYPSEVFVDLGAFVGDTIEEYIFERTGMFGRIYAFRKLQ